MSTIIIPNVRLSFAYLHTVQPGKTDQGIPDPARDSYSAAFILDKKVNAKSIAEINTIVATLKKHPKLAGKIVKKLPLRDGAERKRVQDGEEVFMEGYGPDVMFVSANNRRRGPQAPTKPVLIDMYGKALEAESGKPYSGCYVNAKLELYPYVHPASGAGITASIITVQFLKDGEPFGGYVDPMAGMTISAAPGEEIL